MLEDTLPEPLKQHLAKSKAALEKIVRPLKERAAAEAAEAAKKGG